MQQVFQHSRRPNVNVRFVYMMTYLLILFFFFNNFEKQQKNHKIMQDDLSKRMIQVLTDAIQWAQNKQRKLLAEVLNLQKKINNMHDTKTVVRKKQIIEVKKQEIKEENMTTQFQNKIDEMINKAKEEIQIMDNPVNIKSKANLANKTKYIQPLPPIQKKPPIPTINRSKQPQSFMPKPNYHYRNKNEVTGKITQTPIMKPNNKANSNSNSMQKQQTTTIFNNSTDKNKNISQKVIVKKQQSASTTKASISNQLKRQVQSLDKKQTKIPEEKITYVNFACFKVSIQDLIERANQKNQRKTGSKRQTIQKLIGHRQNQKKASKNFVASFNKLSATRSRLPIPQGLRIEPRNWQGHLQTFNFQNILDNFQSLLDRNPISQDYAPDPKEVYKIKCWHQLINSIFEEEIKPARDNLKPPPILGINFQMNTNQSEDIQIDDQKSNNAIENPYLSNFYQILQEQLQELKNLQNFDKQALKKLRMLVSIGIYNGKRSPVLIQVPKYQEWKKYYEQ